MRQFFLGQMDYILFVYGLSFFLLFLVCLGLQKHRTSIPWHWLGLFGLTHGLNEWADLLAISLTDHAFLHWIRIVLLLLSFAALFEFGRLTFRHPQSSLGRSVYVPVALAIACLGGFLGESGLTAGVRYFLGFLGGMLAARGISALSKRESAPALAVAGFAMGLYAVLSGLVGPKVEIFPANFLNQLSFLSWTGVPIQLLRALSAGAIAAGIWYYDFQDRDNKALAIVKPATAFMAVFLLVILGGAAFVNRIGKNAAAEQSSINIQLAQQLASSIDLDYADVLEGSSNDAQSDAYQYLRGHLLSLRQMMPDIHFIGVARKMDDQVVVLAGSGGERNSTPGQMCERAQDILGALASGKSVVTVERGGEWISTYSVLRNHRGQDETVLRIDKSVRNFNAPVAKARLMAIALVAFFSFVSIVFFVHYRRVQEGLLYAESAGLFVGWGMFGLVLIIGLAGTALIFWGQNLRAQESFRKEFFQRADTHVNALKDALERQVDRLVAIRYFYDGSVSVSRQEFRQFVSHLIQDNCLQAIGWAPRVPHAARVDFEILARQEGLEGFEFTEIDETGKSRRAGERAEYFPALYVQPRNGNEFLRGLDLTTDPVFNSALTRGRDEGNPVATAPVLSKEFGHMFCIFVPVYQGGDYPQTVEARGASLKGYIFGVYCNNQFFDHVLSGMPVEGLAASIEDSQDSGEPAPVYRQQAILGTVDWKNPLRYQVPLLIAGRHWKVTVLPGSFFYSDKYSRASYYIPPLGIILTTLLAFIVNMLFRGRYRMEMLVRQRTNELNREKEALAASEERFRQLAEVSGEFIWEVDARGKYTYASPTARTMYGYEPEELVGKRYFFDFFPPEHKEELVKSIFEGIDRRESFKDFQNPVVRRDGRKAILLTNAMPVLDKDGSLKGYRGIDIDITEAKNAEDTLRKREAYLRSILDNFPYLAWLKDFDGRFLAVNQLFASACGKRVEDVVGKTDFEVWPAELAQKYCAEDVRVIRGKKKSVVEEPIVSGDSISYFETYKSPILDGEGRVIGTTGFARDITERKKAEEALKASEVRFRQIASAITDYIYSVYIEDGQPVRTHYSQACLAVTGYSIEEFRSDPSLWIHIVPEEDRALVSRQIRDIFSGVYEVGPIEHRIVTKDGRVCWVKSTIVIHRDASGRLVSYDGLISDITARRQAEKVLEDQKRAMDEHAIVSKTDAEGRITYVNDKFCEISKLSREYLIGKDHRVINSGYHSKTVFATLWRTISSGRVWQGKIRNRAGDGSYYWLQSTIVPFLDEQGKVTEYISVRTDITQSVENEERLVKAMQVKNNFVSTVSHELRTPLASIKSSVDIINTEVPGPLTDDQKMFIGRVKSNIDRLARLINDVLDLSKLESGKMSMNPVPLRVEDIVREVVEMQRAVKGKNIRMETEFSDGLPTVAADRDRLIQVLSNLLNNALKFTAEGFVKVSVGFDQKFMCFSVIDTGPGIKEEDVSKLFQKFQQLGSASQQVSGTGLGLAICKEIVEKHGGRIWVESEYGKGSVFHFSLPLSQQKRILVVDDDPSTVMLIRKILEGTGKYKVDTAEDGFLAGQKFIEFDPQLILIDISLPKVNGLAVCSKIKRNPKTMKTRVVIMSSFTSDTEKKAWESGADEILLKPFHAEDLLSKVVQLC